MFSWIYPYFFLMICDLFRFSCAYHSSSLFYILVLLLILTFYFTFNVLKKVIYLNVRFFLKLFYYFEFDYLFFYSQLNEVANITHLNMSLAVLKWSMQYVYFSGFFLFVKDSILSVYCSLTLKLYHYYNITFNNTNSFAL